MLNGTKNECIHITSNNLISMETFKKIPFEKLKKEKYDLICLICGECFSSQNINKIFNEHYKGNKQHCLYININNLNIFCLECKLKQKDKKTEDDNNVYYIQSPISEEYINIIENYIYGEDNIKENDNNNKLIFKSKNVICTHVETENIIDEFKEKIINDYKVKLNLKLFLEFNCFCICLSCGEGCNTYNEIEEHFEINKHKLFIDLIDWTIICHECESKYKLELMEHLKKYRIISQILHEKKLNIPKSIKGLTKEEIYEKKYENFIKDFQKGKFSKILIMVGAGISTSAGIPDFRSSTGLFKQLQDKYKLSSPEEFFMKETFLKKPQYFYEFTRLFDLSKVKPTISHIFMNFLVNKNLVKYIFTQNIDGLEKKAKIPEDKLIYAHGNFYTGHCPKCKIPIDIDKINKYINRGKIYYCQTCLGPCKPNVVFYGESLPSRFFEKIKELKENKDIDLIIIMGTSLKVMPFANIPNNINPYAYKVVFNMDKVGDFFYEKLTEKAIFIEGKTDSNVIKFLKDASLYKEFEEFVKKEYNEELEKMINIEPKLKKDNNDIDELIAKIKDNLNLDDYK